MTTSTPPDEDRTRVRLSVCIPCHTPEPEHLLQGIDSAIGQLPQGAEVLLFPNGPAVEIVQGLALPPGVEVRPSSVPLDIVRNWNRCLTESAGELVHLLHQDDVVAPGFYAAILDLADRFPQAGIYATAGAPLAQDGTALAPPGPAEPVLLLGDDAAAFFLDDERHYAGNVVFSRRTIERRGLLLPEFMLCPDEEAYLRYAADGGVALDPRPLYLQRTHPGQMRLGTWLRDDFVEAYLGSRLAGAAFFGPRSVDRAYASSTRRLVSVVVTLALGGYGGEGAKRLDELVRLHPPAGRSPRVRLARLVSRSSPFLRLVGSRRRARERRRMSSSAT